MKGVQAPLRLTSVRVLHSLGCYLPLSFPLTSVAGKADKADKAGKGRQGEATPLISYHSLVRAYPLCPRVVPSCPRQRCKGCEGCEGWKYANVTRSSNHTPRTCTLRPHSFVSLLVCSARVPL